MKLSSLKPGEKGVIVKVGGHGGFRKRLIEMGFVRGQKISVVLGAPLRDPVEYEIMGYKISLRREEAALVEIVEEREVDEHSSVSQSPANKTSEEKAVDSPARCPLRYMANDDDLVIRVALVGNPNCGKTSLFNMATKSHEHVGNYSGVTVDVKEGTFEMTIGGSEEGNAACSGCCAGTACVACKGRKEINNERRTFRFRLVDLPGTYSLTSYSPEERAVVRYLTEEMPDVVINVVDATNLERNLYLTTQLIDMNISLVTALNMYDAMDRRGDRLDYVQLGKLLGNPMVPTAARTGRGLRELFETVVAVYLHQKDDALARHIHVNHGATLEESIDRIKRVFKQNTPLRSRYSTRFLAIKTLEGDPATARLIETLPEHDEIVTARFEETKRLKEELQESPENLLADAKYGFIKGALKETHRPRVARPGETKTDRIDRLVTHRYFGFPIFFVLLFLIFYATFELGAYPMDWIDAFVGLTGDFLRFVMPEGMVRDMIVDGALSGVGAVIVFLPNILLLYLFISLLEDSGYMARAAFLMDRIMHGMGLHGKSFIPMVMGFGCNVPAVMATRTIESPKSRLITMMVIPFMSCSARIPIYIVLCSAFFPAYGSLVMMGLYLTGILVAVLTARLMSRFIMKGEDYPFVMELPPYRLPSSRSVMRHTWEKCRQYLKKMGGIILVCSLIVWALSYFPAGFDRPLMGQSVNERVESVSEDVAVSSESPSYIERLGKTVAPVFAPLGFDWRMSVSLISGLGAKELVVSTLAVLVSGEETDGEDVAADSRLSQTLRAGMTPTASLAYLVFVLLYFPCLATITAIKSESGRLRYAVFTAVYTTVVAYLGASLVVVAAAVFG